MGHSKKERDKATQTETKRERISQIKSAWGQNKKERRNEKEWDKARTNETNEEERDRKRIKERKKHQERTSQIKKEHDTKGEVRNKRNKTIKIEPNQERI